MDALTQSRRHRRTSITAKRRMSEPPARIRIGTVLRWRELPYRCIDCCPSTGNADEVGSLSCCAAIWISKRGGIAGRCRAWATVIDRAVTTRISMTISSAPKPFLLCILVGIGCPSSSSCHPSYRTSTRYLPLRLIDLYAVILRPSTSNSCCSFCPCVVSVNPTVTVESS